MIAFDVKDMSCGHCVSTVMQAIKGVDRAATVTIDLARHRVEIEPAAASAQELSEAIAEAGYTPVSA